MKTPKEIVIHPFDDEEDPNKHSNELDNVFSFNDSPIRSKFHFGGTNSDCESNESQSKNESDGDNKFFL